MRNIINNVIATGVVLLCVVPTISFAMCDNSLSKKIAFSVHPKQKIYNDLTSCKKIPNNPELTIFTSILEKEIIPGAEEDLSGSEDLSVIIAKTDSGDVIASYLKKDFYNTGNGGTNFAEIKIDTANYRLNNDTRAFGIVSIFDGRYGVSEQITLYILKENKIVPILKNLNLISSPTNNGFEIGCAGIIESDTKRIISMSPQMTNNFFDILINEKQIKYKVTKKSCDEDKPKVESTSTQKYKLQYDNKKGIYNVPEEIAYPDVD